MSRNFNGGENLEENKDYRVYRYGDDLKPGYELKVEHSVSCENVDISALIAMGTESLEAMRQGNIDGEQKAYEIVLAAAKQWEQQAVAIKRELAGWRGNQQPRLQDDLQCLGRYEI